MAVLGHHTYASMQQWIYEEYNVHILIIVNVCDKSSLCLGTHF
jgi:hypothetical protein